MEENDPSQCSSCGNPLQADYIVVDQGHLSWCLCSWKCVQRFAANPSTERAARTARGKLHKAWVSGQVRWYVYRTSGGGLVRKVREYLIPFKSLAGAVSSAKSEAGPNATEIPTHAP